MLQNMQLAAPEVDSVLVQLLSRWAERGRDGSPRSQVPVTLSLIWQHLTVWGVELVVTHQASWLKSTCVGDGHSLTHSLTHPPSHPLTHALTHSRQVAMYIALGIRAKLQYAKLWMHSAHLCYWLHCHCIRSYSWTFKYQSAEPLSDVMRDELDNECTS